MPRPTLRIRRLTLVPLADEHLDLEAKLDVDPEVMRHLGGPAGSRAEVERAHRRRLAFADEVEYEITRTAWQQQEARG